MSMVNAYGYFFKEEINLCHKFQYNVTQDMVFYDSISKHKLYFRSLVLYVIERVLLIRLSAIIKARRNENVTHE